MVVGSGESYTVTKDIQVDGYIIPKVLFTQSNNQFRIYKFKILQSSICFIKPLLFWNRIHILWIRCIHRMNHDLLWCRDNKLTINAWSQCWSKIVSLNMTFIFLILIIVKSTSLVIFLCLLLELRKILLFLCLLCHSETLILLFYFGF